MAEQTQSPPKQHKSDGNAGFLRAARDGNLEEVLDYLRGSTDINTSNPNGLNALHLASKEGHINIVSELLKRGANVEAATKKGNTALHIASLAGHEDIVVTLVENGAQVNLQAQAGFTPLYMAAQEGHAEVVKFLLSSGANQGLSTEDGFTPLAVALQQGHDKVVSVLLEHDAKGKVRLPALHIAAKKDDVKSAALLLQNEQNSVELQTKFMSGFTPLHIAAHYGNTNVANLLIQRNADVNFRAKNNITPLHVGSRWGKLNMVNLLLDSNAAIDEKTRDGLTPLHCAARSGHDPVVDTLLEKGAPHSAKTKNGLTPLHMAAQGDHEDCARLLLYHKASLNEVTVDYLTPLHVAAHCGNVKTAKLLLDRKCEPNARALNGFTPLHIACKKNRIKVVELLLKYGASIESKTESGLTPLHVASFMGHMNIVIYLIQHNANPNTATVRGETSLHLAARANQSDIIRILLRNGATVDARAREQQTPLHIASRLGNVDNVVLLLQHGAVVDSTTKDKYTPMHIAAKEGHEEVVQVLLEHEAQHDITTKKGFTPLHIAAKYGNIKVARLLLQKDANPDVQGKNGLTPLHVATHYNHPNVAQLLLENKANPHATTKNGYTPLHIAAKKNQMDIATMLLEYGAKPNAESKNGFTPLHLAAQEGHSDIVSLLLQKEANVNAKAHNGLTPMHLAAQEDKVPVAEILVKYGSETDTSTKAGYTPLHTACHFGQINMVRFLLDQNASVNATTKVGYTPLHQAAQQGHVQVVSTLLKHQASPNAVTNNGQTPLAIAQKLGYISVVETLKPVTEVHAIVQSSEDKYKVVSPETMQETFISDSEDEGADDFLPQSPIFGKPLSEQHVYLPYYEGQKIQTREDSISLERGGSTSPLDVSFDKDYMDAQITSQSYTAVYSAPPSSGTRLPVGGEANRFSSYSGSSFSTSFDPDNVPVDRSPVYSGFLISFMVDARGGAMRGCRHPCVRIIIPPRKCSMPTRVTCRLVKREKLTRPPPMLEGEGLAARVLEMGPVGTKFLGPVLLEVPHFASLRGKEREVVILRSDNGETWYEHPMQATEEAVAESLGSSAEGGVEGSQASVASLWKLDSEEDLNTKRIKRILTTDLPMYFALVSRVTRVKQESTVIGNEGGVLSSNVVPQVQAVFPEGTLTRPIPVGLQAQPIAPELVAKLLGNRVAVSPIVTVEPRRRRFHKPITLTIPVPRAAQKGMINQYGGERPTLRLLFSLAGNNHSHGRADTNPAVWEDVTDSKPITLVDDCVSFTTSVSARFWLIDCQNVAEAAQMASVLYQEAVTVPYMAKFVVFAKRDSPEEGKLRVFCMTDDKDDKTLEKQEKFFEVARSRDIEVLEGRPQFVEMAGNLIPVTKSGDQLHVNFRAFRENRLPCTVKIRDQDQEPSARVAFMKEPKVARGEAPQTPICNLNIRLPDMVGSDSGELDADKAAEVRKRHDFLRGQGLVIQDSVNKAEMKLSDIADNVQGDWVMLAQQLQVSISDINHIKNDYKTVGDQALAMLHLWVQKNGDKATGNELETALRRINRDDVVRKCMYNVERVDDEVEAAAIRATMDQSGFDTFKEEVGITKDSMKRGMSLDVQYDEQDMIKESESATEESPTHDKESPPRQPGAPQLSSTQDTEEDKKSIQEEDILRTDKVSPPEAFPSLRAGVQVSATEASQPQLQQQQEQVQQLQQQQQQLQQQQEVKQQLQEVEQQLLEVEQQEQEQVLLQQQQAPPEEIMEAEAETVVAAPPKSHVTFADEPDRGRREYEDEEEVQTPPPSPTGKFNAEEKSGDVDDDEEDEEEEQEITEIVETYRVSEDGKWETVEKTTTITAQGTSEKIEVHKEEPSVLATESSIAEAATRLASEATDDFDSEGRRTGGPQIAQEQDVLYSRAEVEREDAPETYTVPALHVTSEPSSQIVSPSSETGSSYHEEPSPVPEPALPVDFREEELAFEKPDGGSVDFASPSDDLYSPSRDTFGTSISYGPEDGSGDKEPVPSYDRSHDSDDKRPIPGSGTDDSSDRKQGEGDGQRDSPDDRELSSGYGPGDDSGDKTPAGKYDADGGYGGRKQVQDDDRETEEGDREPVTGDSREDGFDGKEPVAIYGRGDDRSYDQGPVETYDPTDDPDGGKDPRESFRPEDVDESQQRAGGYVPEDRFGDRVPGDESAPGDSFDDRVPERSMDLSSDADTYRTANQSLDDSRRLDETPEYVLGPSDLEKTPHGKQVDRADSELDADRTVVVAPGDSGREAGRAVGLGEYDERSFEDGTRPDKRYGETDDGNRDVVEPDNVTLVGQAGPGRSDTSDAPSAEGRRLGPDGQPVLEAPAYDTEFYGSRGPGITAGGVVSQPFHGTVDLSPGRRDLTAVVGDEMCIDRSEEMIATTTRVLSREQTPDRPLGFQVAFSASPLANVSGFTGSSMGESTTEATQGFPSSADKDKLQDKDKFSLEEQEEERKEERISVTAEQLASTEIRSEFTETKTEFYESRTEVSEKEERRGTDRDVSFTEKVEVRETFRSSEPTEYHVAEEKALQSEVVTDLDEEEEPFLETREEYIKDDEKEVVETFEDAERYEESGEKFEMAREERQPPTVVQTEEVTRFGEEEVEAVEELEREETVAVRAEEIFVPAEEAEVLVDETVQEEDVKMVVAEVVETSSREEEEQVVEEYVEDVRMCADVNAVETTHVEDVKLAMTEPSEDVLVDETSEDAGQSVGDVEEKPTGLTDESPITDPKYTSLTDPLTQDLVREKVETIEEVVTHMEKRYEFQEEHTREEFLVESQEEVKSERKESREHMEKRYEFQEEDAHEEFLVESQEEVKSERKESREEFMGREYRSDYTEDMSETTQDFSEIKSELVESLESQYDIDSHRDFDTDRDQPSESREQDRDEIEPAREPEAYKDDVAGDKYVELVQTPDDTETPREIVIEAVSHMRVENEGQHFAVTSVVSETFEDQREGRGSEMEVIDDVKEETTLLDSDVGEVKVAEEPEPADEIPDVLGVEEEHLVEETVERVTGEEAEVTEAVQEFQSDVVYDEEDKENIEPAGAMDEGDEYGTSLPPESWRGAMAPSVLRALDRGIDEELDSIAATAGSDDGADDEDDRERALVSGEISDEKTSDEKCDGVDEDEEEGAYDRGFEPAEDMGEKEDHQEALDDRNVEEPFISYEVRQSEIKVSSLPEEEKKEIQEIVKEEVHETFAESEDHQAMASVPDEEEEVIEAFTASQAKQTKAGIYALPDEEESEVEEEKDIVEVKEEMRATSTTKVSHTFTQELYEEHNVSESQRIVPADDVDSHDGRKETDVSTLPDEEEDEVEEVTGQDAVHEFEVKETLVGVCSVPEGEVEETRDFLDGGVEDEDDEDEETESMEIPAFGSGRGGEDELSEDEMSRHIEDDTADDLAEFEETEKAIENGLLEKEDAEDELEKEQSYQTSEQYSESVHSTVVHEYKFETRMESLVSPPQVDEEDLAVGGAAADDEEAWEFLDQTELTSEELAQASTLRMDGDQEDEAEALHHPDDERVGEQQEGTEDYGKRDSVDIEKEISSEGQVEYSDFLAESQTEEEDQFKMTEDSGRLAKVHDENVTEEERKIPEEAVEERQESVEMRQSFEKDMEISEVEVVSVTEENTGFKLQSVDDGLAELAQDEMEGTPVEVEVRRSTESSEETMVREGELREYQLTESETKITAHQKVLIETRMGSIEIEEMDESEMAKEFDTVRESREQEFSELQETKETRQQVEETFEEYQMTEAKSEQSTLEEFTEMSSQQLYSKEETVSGEEHYAHTEEIEQETLLIPSLPDVPQQSPHVSSDEDEGDKDNEADELEEEKLTTQEVVDLKVQKDESESISEKPIGSSPEEQEEIEDYVVEEEELDVDEELDQEIEEQDQLTAALISQISRADSEEDEEDGVDLEEEQLELTRQMDSKFVTDLQESHHLITESSLEKITERSTDSEMTKSQEISDSILEERVDKSPRDDGDGGQMLMEKLDTDTKDTPSTEEGDYSMKTEPSLKELKEEEEEEERKMLEEMERDEDVSSAFEKYEHEPEVSIAIDAKVGEVAEYDVDIDKAFEKYEDEPEVSVPIDTKIKSLDESEEETKEDSIERAEETLEVAAVSVDQIDSAQESADMVYGEEPIILEHQEREIPQGIETVESVEDELYKLEQEEEALDKQLEALKEVETQELLLEKEQTAEEHLETTEESLEVTREDTEVHYAEEKTVETKEVEEYEIELSRAIVQEALHTSIETTRRLDSEREEMQQQIVEEEKEQVEVVPRSGIMAEMQELEEQQARDEVMSEDDLDDDHYDDEEGDEPELEDRDISQQLAEDLEAHDISEAGDEVIPDEMVQSVDRIEEFVVEERVTSSAPVEMTRSVDRIEEFAEQERDTSIPPVEMTQSVDRIEEFTEEERDTSIPPVEMTQSVDRIEEFTEEERDTGISEMTRSVDRIEEFTVVERQTDESRKHELREKDIFAKGFCVTLHTESHEDIEVKEETLLTSHTTVDEAVQDEEKKGEETDTIINDTFVDRTEHFLELIPNVIIVDGEGKDGPYTAQTFGGGFGFNALGSIGPRIESDFTPSSSDQHMRGGYDQPQGPVDGLNMGLHLPRSPFYPTSSTEVQDRSSSPSDLDEEITEMEQMKKMQQQQQQQQPPVFSEDSNQEELIISEDVAPQQGSQVSSNSDRHETFHTPASTFMSSSISGSEYTSQSDVDYVQSGETTGTGSYFTAPSEVMSSSSYTAQSETMTGSECTMTGSEYDQEGGDADEEYESEGRISTDISQQIFIERTVISKRIAEEPSSEDEEADLEMDRLDRPPSPSEFTLIASQDQEGLNRVLGLTSEASSLTSLTTTTITSNNTVIETTQYDSLQVQKDSDIEKDSLQGDDDEEEIEQEEDEEDDEVEEDDDDGGRMSVDDLVTDRPPSPSDFTLIASQDQESLNRVFGLDTAQSPEEDKDEDSPMQWEQELERACVEVDAQSTASSDAALMIGLDRVYASGGENNTMSGVSSESGQPLDGVDSPLKDQFLADSQDEFEDRHNIYEAYLRKMEDAEAVDKEDILQKISKLSELEKEEGEEEEGERYESENVDDSKRTSQVLSHDETNEESTFERKEKTREEEGFDSRAEYSSPQAHFVGFSETHQLGEGELQQEVQEHGEEHKELEESWKISALEDVKKMEDLETASFSREAKMETSDSLMTFSEESCESVQKQYSEKSSYSHVSHERSETSVMFSQKIEIVGGGEEASCSTNEFRPKVVEEELKSGADLVSGGVEAEEEEEERRDVVAAMDIHAMDKMSSSSSEVAQLDDFDDQAGTRAVHEAHTSEEEEERAGDESRGSAAQGDSDEVETHRLMMKKEVHKKTTIGPDGREETTIHEDSQVQQENEPPEELRESMQEIINQFMETDPQPAQLPAPESHEDEV